MDVDVDGRPIYLSWGTLLAPPNPLECGRRGTRKRAPATSRGPTASAIGSFSNAIWVLLRKREDSTQTDYR